MTDEDTSTAVMSDYSILGSCVTRDAADLGTRPLKAPSAFFSRTKIQSVVSSPTPVPKDIGLGSAFQTRVVVQDHRKTALQVLRGSSDPLVIDLIDERFGLLDTGHGLVTNSLYRRKSSLSKGGSGSKVPDDEELAAEGPFAVAASALGKELAGVPVVVIHEAMWATQTREGARLDDAAEGERRNDWLRRAYDILHAAFPQSVRVAPEAEVVRADPEHRWGLAAFHYIPEYYDDVAAKVRHVLGRGDAG